MTESSLHIRDLGFTPYEEAWCIQRELQERLLQGAGQDTLVMCEHEPVITIGRSAKRENILAGDRELEERGIRTYAVERGGDVTWHGPGQLVCYPIIDLNGKRRDVHWYVRGLEEVVIAALARFGLNGMRWTGKSGVWIEGGAGEPPRKISSLGVRISRWRTLHGFALNVLRCEDGFRLIRPCGLAGVRMTSMQEECEARGMSGELTVQRTAAVVAEEFKKVFDYH